MTLSLFIIASERAIERIARAMATEDGWNWESSDESD